MHRFLELYILYWTFSVANADLCDSVRIRYNIGKLTSIIDVPAETISQMQRPCTKDVVIPGARESEFRAVQADFGHNLEYKYSGLIGYKKTPVYDQIVVHFGKCSASTRAVNVTTGLQEEFTSSRLCLRIKPEIDHRTLGGHVPGTRIKLSVRVDVALCHWTSSSMDINRNDSCQPLCNSSGITGNCLTETPESSTTHRMTKTTTEPATGQGSTQPRTTGQTSPMPYTTTSKHYAITTYNDTVATAPSTIRPDTSVTTTHSASPSRTNTKIQAITFRTNTETAKYSVATTQTTQRSTTLATASSYPATSADDKSTVYPGNTSRLTTSTAYNSNYTQPNTNREENVTTPSSGENTETDEKNHIFGMLEGLYVIAGCIFLLLFFGVLAFLVRRRSNKLSGGSNTESSPRNGLHWRDNWLVRYHDNEIESDSFSELASDINYIHSNFLSQSNTELQHIHHTGYVDIVKNKSEEDPYDNPWPLVRLDSDFVKNTRSLERERSSEGQVGVKDDTLVENNVTSHERDEENHRDTEGEDNSKQKENSSGKDKASENKHSFPKHIGSPMVARGKYHITKVERSNSTKSGRTPRHAENTNSNSKDHKRTKSESHLIRRDSSRKKGARQRNSSSTCSEYSPTFEEMLQDEIHNIEDVLDSNSNADNESNGSDCVMKKNWRVSTLYAIVSPRNGLSPRDVVPKRPSQKRNKSVVNRSESYRRFDFAVSKIKPAVRSPSRTSSLYKEGNILFEKNQMGVDMTNGLANDSYKPPRKIESEAQTVHDKANDSDNNNTSEFAESRVPMAQRNSGKNDAETNTDVRSAFQQNREMFEQNGSIAQNSKPNSGASGTGQFPK